MKTILFALVILVSGCARENPSNYSCSPSMLNDIDQKAKECAKTGATATYDNCLRSLKMAFCKFNE